MRGDFFLQNKAEARAKLGLSDEKPLVVTSWGSLGALVMNQHMVDFVVRECREGQPFHHIYGVGKRYYERVRQALADRGIDLEQYPCVDVREYIYDMPVVLSAADVMLSRAGASTISEISAIACPSILVPSPNVTANHQEKNARDTFGPGSGKADAGTGLHRGQPISAGSGHAGRCPGAGRNEPGAEGYGGDRCQ